MDLAETEYAVEIEYPKGFLSKDYKDVIIASDCRRVAAHIMSALNASQLER